MGNAQKREKRIMKEILLIILILAILGFVPIAAIWSVNTLFLTSIPITFDTWLASLLLSSGVLYGR